MEQSAEFEGRIPKIEDMNTKWQAHLKDQDIKDLQEAIGSIDLASS
jgi:hypothetical protein